MPLNSGQFDPKRSTALWRIFIFVLIFALGITLATRVFHVHVSSTTSVQSGASQGMRQHLDSDAVHWTPPVQSDAHIEVVSFYPRVAPAGPPLPSQLFDQSLYNRPPPAC